ncbi:MAG: DUF4149 domain-containing protein [Pseudomonadota bacterium]
MISLAALSRFAAHLALTLWVGGLWIVGFVATPALFATLDDRALAGTVAGRLFTTIGHLGFACGAVLLAVRCRETGSRFWRDRMAWVVILMLALVAVGHFGLQPMVAELRDAGYAAAPTGSAERAAFGAWHGAASAVYLLVSLLGLALVWLAGRCRGG